MKTLFFCCLLLISGCSTIDLYPSGHFVDLSKKSEDDLVKESQANYKESGMDDFVPSKNEKDEYFKSLESSVAYRNYLFIECVRLLHQEHNLDLKNAVYASLPEWSKLNSWYSTIFNFHTLATGSSPAKEMTMECDLTVNKKKEVSEYQLINYAAKFIKN